MDGEICRICEQALAGDDLPVDLRAGVSSRYAQVLLYRCEYDRAGEVSRDALAAAGSSDDPVVLVDALRARQMACCAPEGVTERVVLARRMLEAANSTGSAWVEMWARLWRIDTLFETGELRSVHGELADLGLCLERLRAPLGRWHSLEWAATLALATGRFSEAVRLSREAFTLISGMGHPVAFGGYAVILCQAGLHIGFDRSGATELFGHIPAHLKPRPRGRRGGLCPGGTGPVMDAFSRYALVVLGTRADGRHRPGQDGGHGVPGGAVRAVPRPARREWRRRRGLHGSGRAAARTCGRCAGPSRRGGRGPADGDRDLRRQRRTWMQRGAVRRVRHRPRSPPSAGRPGSCAGRAVRRGGRGRPARNGAVHQADRTAAGPAAGRGGRRAALEPPPTRGGPARRARTDQQADRPGPVRLRADGREPRAAHPHQARVQQPQPDRRVVQRGAAAESRSREVAEP